MDAGSAWLRCAVDRLHGTGSGMQVHGQRGLYGSLQERQSGLGGRRHTAILFVSRNAHHSSGPISPAELETRSRPNRSTLRRITSSASFDSDTVGVINSPVPHMEEFAHFDSEISYGMHFVELWKRGSGEW